MDFSAQLLVINIMMHLSQILFGADQIVWRDLAPLLFPRLLQHLQEFLVSIGFQVAESRKLLGQQFEIVIRDDTVIVDIQQAVQGAHLAAPEIGVALAMQKVKIVE